MSVSQQSQGRKSSSSPFSRDVFLTNQKLKSLQQHTEKILKKNKQKNKTLQNNLNSLKGSNGTSSNEEVPSSSFLAAQSQSTIKGSASSATTSPKVSPRDIINTHLKSNTSQTKLTGTNKTQINSLQNIPKSLSQIPQSSISTHNLSKQAQNTLKQLQNTLHNTNHSNISKSQNRTPPKYTQDAALQNNRISALASSNKNVSVDDTPKFKPQKNCDQHGQDQFQFSSLCRTSGVEEYHPSNGQSILSSVFSFGHESEEEEERIKRGEPARPSQFSQQKDKQSNEKKKRVSFCDPTIHTYSTNDDKRFDAYFPEKVPQKSTLQAQSLTQIPSCLSQKNSHQRSSSPLPITQITQPVSIIKKNDNNSQQQLQQQQQQQYQRSSFNSSNDVTQISSCTSSISQNINSNNNQNIPQNKISTINNQIEQLNNHVIFESFAPKQPHQILINGVQQQPYKPTQIAPNPNQSNQRYINTPQANGQQHQPNSISFIIQNALKNLNNVGNTPQDVPSEIKCTSPIILSVNTDNNNDKLEEVRKNLIKRDQDITQIISSSPMKKTTSHEYILCNELMGGQVDQFCTRSEIAINGLNTKSNDKQNNNNLQTQQTVGSNVQTQINNLAPPNLSPDVQTYNSHNTKIESDKNLVNYNINSNLLLQRNNQQDTTNPNSDTQLIKNLSSSAYTTSFPQSSIPQSQSGSTLLNNFINNNPTITVTNSYQQPFNTQQKDNIQTATSSFVSQLSPQTTLVGSSNFANTDIKLSVIQPVATFSFALGSQITLSPQESITSIQSSQNYNNIYSNNINPLNSYYSTTNTNNSNLNVQTTNNFNNNQAYQYSNVVYLSNQKGITMPTSLSSSSDACTNSNTTANTNNSCTYNLDIYKVSVPSFNVTEKEQNRYENSSQNDNQSSSNSLSINAIKINLESISNSSLFNNSKQDEQKDCIANSNTGTNSTQNINYLAENITNKNQYISNSPFSTQSNQNTTMTTTTTNNRQSFDTNLWRNEAELTPSEYFLTFITNNPKPCPKPSIIGGGTQTPQMNATRKNSSLNPKDSFIGTQSHFIPMIKQSLEMNLENSLDLYQNNFSVSSSIIHPNNNTNNLSYSNHSQYGLQQSKQSKSPQRLAATTTNSLKSSYCSTSGLAKRQQTQANQQNTSNQQKNKSFSNYISSSSNNIRFQDNNAYQPQQTQSSLSPSKHIMNIQQQESQSNQKRPIFLEYNSVSTIKKPSKNNEVTRKVTSQLNSRKASQQSTVKKDVSSLYNISKITSQNNIYNNNNNNNSSSSNLNNKKNVMNQHLVNSSKDIPSPNCYQVQNNTFEKEASQQQNYNSQQVIIN